MENVEGGRQSTVRAQMDVITDDHIETPRGETRQRLLRIIQQMLPGAITQARSGAISLLPNGSSSNNDSSEPFKAKIMVDTAKKRKREQHATEVIIPPTPVKLVSADNTLGNTSVQLDNPNQGPIICHNCGKQGHTKPQCAEDLQTCRWCQRKGHMINFCKITDKRTTTFGQNKRRSNNLGTDLIICHNCGKEGHIKPVCTEPLRTCRGCGKTGHMKKFCRTIKGNKTSGD